MKKPITCNVIDEEIEPKGNIIGEEIESSCDVTCEEIVLKGNVIGEEVE